MISVLSKNNGWSMESLEDRVHKLQTDKESLLLQVSVLNDQVEAQGYKITDLEGLLDERLCKLQRAEDVLQNVSKMLQTSTGLHDYCLWLGVQVLVYSSHALTFVSVAARILVPIALNSVFTCN